MAKCGTCGYLAQRAQWEHGPMPDWYEVQPEARSDPAKARRLYVASGALELKANIYCYRQIEAFPAADLTVDVLDTNPARALAALRSERTCTEWLAHIPGLDPRAHLMERRFRELEADRSSFEKALNRNSNRLVVASLVLGTMIGFAQIFVGVLALSDQSWVYKHFLGPFLEIIQLGAR